MRLAHKLTLAFVFVGLVAIGLAALFVWVTTSAGFARYLVDQRQEQFVAAVTDHYEAREEWAGVDATLRQQGLLPPPAAPGSPPPDPQPFVLIDANHVVIVPGGDYKLGQRIQKSVLERGIDIQADGSVVGTVLSTGQAPVRSRLDDRYLAGVNRSLVVAALGGVGIALLLGLLVARNLTRPVRELTAATRAVAQGNLEQQVSAGSSDELGDLARAFNQMSSDLARANLLRRQMTADIAHDLRNPLTVIGGYLESLADSKLTLTTERFAIIQAEVQHLQRLVEDLRTLSLADTGELTLHREPTEARGLLERVRAAYQHQAEGHRIALTVEVDPDVKETSLDPDRIGQVLENLVSNALRYTPEGGEIRLSARWSQESLNLSVRDNGSGIPPEALPHIFERSYRGDAARHGDESGLGLAIARSIVELHGGSIQAASDSSGTELTISLPMQGSRSNPRVGGSPSDPTT